jgi:hypothetical protein
MNYKNSLYKIIDTMLIKQKFQTFFVVNFSKFFRHSSTRHAGSEGREAGRD